MDNSKLIVFSAPSGAGKTSFVKRLLKEFKNISFSVSYTTRDRRFEEIDGKDYNFVSSEVFNEMIGNDEFVEFQEVYKGFLYGTSKNGIIESLKKFNVILDIDVKGALKVKEENPQAILIFIKPPSLIELEKRLRNRGTETEESILIRITRAKEEMTFERFFDYTFINDDFEKTYQEIKFKILETIT